MAVVIMAAACGGVVGNRKFASFDEGRVQQDHRYTAINPGNLEIIPANTTGNSKLARDVHEAR